MIWDLTTKNVLTVVKLLFFMSHEFNQGPAWERLVEDVMWIVFNQWNGKDINKSNVIKQLPIMSCDIELNKVVFYFTSI